MRSQIVTASKGPNRNWSQIVTSSPKHRGLSYLLYAFTEQGVAMLSSVLRSPRAVEVNIAIMRTFVRAAPHAPAEPAANRQYSHSQFTAGGSGARSVSRMAASAPSTQPSSPS